MSKIWMPGGAGGGAGSDECTLVKANVPTGLKAVTADSDDEAVEGTLDTETTLADSQVGTYTDLVLVSETSVVASDGTILTTYSLRPKTDVERLEEKVAAVEAGQQVQDGAINDVATLAGTLAEQAGGMS